MATIAEKKQQLIDELAAIDDPQERLAYLCDIAKGAPSLPDDLRIDAFRVEGCVAQLWLVPEFRDGCCYFQVDSDGIISKAVAYAVVDTFSGANPETILKDGPEFLGEVGITQHLTPNRRNGLTSVWQRVQSFAQACADEAK